MVKNKISIKKDLIQDLKNYSSAVCVSLASQIRDEMYKEAKLAIEAFYDDYRPKNGEPLYYKRHYYNFRENSFLKYYKNPHNSIVRGGIELNPYELDDIYCADKEYIFNLVYLGYHGNVNMFPHQISNIPPVMNPSPLDMLLDKRDEIVDNIDRYKNIAINKANNKSYLTLNI